VPGRVWVARGPPYGRFKQTSQSMWAKKNGGCAQTVRGKVLV